MHRVSNNPEETRFIGSEFVRNATAGTVLSLIGDLGAGKTEFVKGLALGLGIDGRVTSPTFTILHEYQRRSSSSFSYGFLSSPRRMGTG